MAVIDAAPRRVLADMIAAVLCHPLATGLACSVGMVLGAAETANQSPLFGWAAIIASLTGLLGTLYAVFSGERRERRRDRRKR